MLMRIVIDGGWVVIAMSRPWCDISFSIYCKGLFLILYSEGCYSIGGMGESIKQDRSRHCMVQHIKGPGVPSLILLSRGLWKPASKYVLINTHRSVEGEKVVNSKKKKKPKQTILPDVDCWGRIKTSSGNYELHGFLIALNPTGKLRSLK